MKHIRMKQAFAGIISMAMLTSSVSAALTVTAAGENVIFETGFEGGEGIAEFTGRGGVEVIEESTELAHSGDYAMCITGREESWNGPQLLLDERCKPDTEYLVSAWAKTEWYSTLNLSMEYTDTEGERHYANLASKQGDSWAEFKDVKVSFTEEMTKVYVYIESSDASCKLFVDDFSLREAPLIPIQEDIPSLTDVYGDYFKIGTALTNFDLTSKSFMNLVQKHFSGSVTVGNEMKPDYLLDQKASLALVEKTGDDTDPQVSLASARGVLNYCRKNNIPVRGHTLVWHSQTPDWFFKENYEADGEWVTKEKMIERMENYIKNVMAACAKEYPDINFYAWDVVNEAWTDSGAPRTAGSNNSSSGSSAWVKVFGDNSFIEYAFKFARKYAPEGCKLYYNDYNEYMTQKIDAVVSMATDLKEKGLIDGIGMQSHLDVGFPSAAMYKNALEKYAATGLDIQVTELDITTGDSSDAGLKTQAKVYSDIFDALVAYKDSISAVVFWGVTDPASWRADQKPLLFDGQYQAKPAFDAIVDDIIYTTQTTTTTTSTTATTTTTADIGKLKLGDVNCDAKVSIADLVLLARYVAEDKEMTPLSPQGIANGDCNQDNKWNSSDITMLARVLAKLDTFMA